MNCHVGRHIAWKNVKQRDKNVTTVSDRERPFTCLKDIGPKMAWITVNHCPFWNGLLQPLRHFKISCFSCDQRPAGCKTSVLRNDHAHCEDTKDPMSIANFWIFWGGSGWTSPGSMSKELNVRPHAWYRTLLENLCCSCSVQFLCRGYRFVSRF